MDTYHKFLRVEGLGKTFLSEKEPKTVLSEVSFELPLPDSLAIVGPSGCGKTTLILAIAGLLQPTTGSVFFQDTVITGPNRNIALVLQEYGLFPWKTVAANIILGAQIQKINISGKRLETVKKELDIEGLDHLYPTQLSGGQRQRVALARALLTNPLLLLLDEPFAAIDTVTRERLENQLLLAFKRWQFSYIIVTHNIEEAVFLGRRIIVLSNDAPSIRTIIDNPAMGDIEYREKPAFFESTTALRKILEETT
jgi:ABC-type nitrate/sulfonate/bicarbonate transport system ATPase subunit